MTFQQCLSNTVMRQISLHYFVSIDASLYTSAYFDVNAVNGLERFYALLNDISKRQYNRKSTGHYPELQLKKNA